MNTCVGGLIRPLRQDRLAARPTGGRAALMWLTFNAGRPRLAQLCCHFPTLAAISLPAPARAAARVTSVWQAERCLWRAHRLAVRSSSSSSSSSRSRSSSSSSSSSSSRNSSSSSSSRSGNGGGQRLVDPHRARRQDPPTRQLTIDDVSIHYARSGGPGSYTLRRPLQSLLNFQRT
eukprot:COSAG05_NODE_343_length_11025_cov_14.803313_7_plen_176_part_00